MTNRASERVLNQKRPRKDSGGSIRFSSQLHSIDLADQLFAGMCYDPVDRGLCGKVDDTEKIFGYILCHCGYLLLVVVFGKEQNNRG